jgi:cell division protein FtsQ
MSLNLNFGKLGKVLLGAIAICTITLLIGFSSDTFSSNRCKKIEINIKNADEQFFVNKQDIEALVTKYGSDQFVGKLFEKIDLREIEQRVLKNKQIKSCQVFRGVEGNLNVDIEQHIPIARILMSDGREDVYVDADGSFFPLSDRYSARILLLSGEYFRNLPSLKSKRQENNLQFLNQINKDAFLKAQFTQLDIAKNGDINIVPLVGNHVIEFGAATNIENRLNRLKIFYNQILPVKGWDGFSQVSVKYDGQIVCK